ncbi:MAG: hypothetical protein JRG89_05635 [Deltaproteobacteria bacterium]|nr:hypothetical protein [Deltaproteobacteria bacterium]MBW2724661.1 hypothetical protein [Deltaproteobacteria bacterium]
MLCWYFSLSLQFRVVPFLKMGGDAFVACTLLFEIFLPLGAYWSWDRRQGRSLPAAGNQVVGIASLALILQICVVYWLTGWLKTGDSWAEGRAVWYLLNLQMLTSPLAPWLLEQEWALGPLTYASHALEKWGPFLLFVPWQSSVLRLFCVVSFCLLDLPGKTRGISLPWSLTRTDTLSFARPRR